MRPMDLTHSVECIISANCHRRRGPLAHAIHSQHSRLRKGRCKEGGCRMALMVLRKEELAMDLAGRCVGPERLFEVRLLKQLLLNPKRDGHPERPEAAWGVCEISLQ